ncbi:phage portal protein [Bacillus sp. L381]|uniref:phage portal protein n=1 Tax=Bacillus TaxID=1386 RepID=UPI000825DB9C|nr:MULTISPECIES: phage portal protein [Bacillus]AOC90689.1 Phage-like element PBSX protein XkdJ [Bacillus amyloliquefaciens]MCR9037791.1 phage portal protein [Bacillus velezensis]QUN10705.1 phage portal protein [Bacillus amyloliquefaciens]QYM83837.1 phage portal protein [Bacillus sp. 7D3]QZY13024.1 phage portal protein [Bacillus amyloliquefaciens]
MNRETGSIAAFLYHQYGVPVYENELPEQFQVPSLYIPPPFVFDENDTVSTFKKIYSLNVKLFHADSVQALDEADRIADAVRESRQMIPLLTESGEDTGDFIRISRIETRVGDKGEAVITIRWTSRYYYKKQTFPALRDVDINSGVKQK